jgi:hypothetical protein
MITGPPKVISHLEIWFLIAEQTYPSARWKVDEGSLMGAFLPEGREKMDIKEHMEVIGADGVHVGTVDKVEGGRIKLTKKDSGEGSHKGHHHFIDKGLIAGVEGNKVRLSANADVAVTMEQEK